MLTADRNARHGRQKKPQKTTLFVFNLRNALEMTETSDYLHYVLLVVVLLLGIHVNIVLRP